MRLVLTYLFLVRLLAPCLINLHLESLKVARGHRPELMAEALAAYSGFVGRMSSLRAGISRLAPVARFHPADTSVADPLTASENWRRDLREIIPSWQPLFPTDISADSISESSTAPPASSRKIPGSIALSARDLLDILPPLSAEDRVVIIENQFNGLDVKIISPEQESPDGYVEWLRLRVNVSGTGAATDHYQINLLSGVMGTQRINAYLNSRGLAYHYRGVDFIVGFQRWLRQLPWHGEAQLTVTPVTARAKALFGSLGFHWEQKKMVCAVAPIQKAVPQQIQGVIDYSRQMGDENRTKLFEDSDVRQAAETILALNPRRVLVVGCALWPVKFLLAILRVQVVYVDMDEGRLALARMIWEAMKEDFLSMSDFSAFDFNVDDMARYFGQSLLIPGSFDVSALLSLLGGKFEGDIRSALENVGRLMRDGGVLFVSNEPIEVGARETMPGILTTMFPGSRVSPETGVIVTDYDRMDQGVLGYSGSAKVAVELRKAA